MSLIHSVAVKCIQHLRDTNADTQRLLTNSHHYFNTSMTCLQRVLRCTRW